VILQNIEESPLFYFFDSALSGCHSSWLPRTAEWSPGSPAPYVNEDTLSQAQVQIERKTFVFSLKENVRGRLLRIAEGTGEKRNSIIIPTTGLLELTNYN
jgi:hypothetical protein